MTKKKEDKKLTKDQVKKKILTLKKDLFNIRFKKINNEAYNDITIYSFRHTGAINIYKRTGSLTKLQQAMGHSSLQVSLTYLRGLEVTELTEEDMPIVCL